MRIRQGRRDFLAGLKVRIPLGMMIPNISVAYGQQLFWIASAKLFSEVEVISLTFATVIPVLLLPGHCSVACS